MTPLRIGAVTTVTVALVLYTIGFLKERRTRRATAGVRGFLTAGVCFDVVATALMVLATRRAELTLHGVLGYSALAAMSIDTVLLWRHAARHAGAPVPDRLHRYSRIAYVYWVAAYVTGAALVMAARAGGAPG